MLWHGDQAGSALKEGIDNSIEDVFGDTCNSCLFKLLTMAHDVVRKNEAPSLARTLVGKKENHTSSLIQMCLGGNSFSSVRALLESILVVLALKPAVG